MKKIITLLSVLSITAAFAQVDVSKKLSNSQISDALDNCRTRIINIESNELGQERKLNDCGGTLKITKKNDGKDAYLTISDVEKCSNLTIGANSDFELKTVSRNYQMDGKNGEYRKSLKIAQDAIYSYDGGKFTRIVVYSNSGSTCERIKASLGKKTVN